MNNGTAMLEPPPQRSRGLQPGVPIRLRGLQWNDYLALSEIIGDRRLLTSFSDGEMEILMPSGEHDVWLILLGRLIEVLASELQLPLKSHGMSTFRREDIEKGLEPDRCYYLVNAPRVRGKLRIDLRVDPPPDLAYEIEITRSAEKRMPIYAGLRVPEVWRFDGETLTVNQLVANGEYIVAERSQFFPMVPINELVRFLRMQEQLLDNELADTFRDWVRTQIKTGWTSVAAPLS